MVEVLAAITIRVSLVMLYATIEVMLLVTLWRLYTDLAGNISNLAENLNGRLTMWAVPENNRNRELVLCALRLNSKNSF